MTFILKKKSELRYKSCNHLIQFFFIPWQKQTAIATTYKVNIVENQLTVSSRSQKDPARPLAQNMYGPCWRANELGSISIKEFSKESGPMMAEICIQLLYSPFFVLSPSSESEPLYSLEIFSLALHLLFISKWLYPE